MKKLGRIPLGGGHRVHGRAATRANRRRGVGYAYLHTAIDDHSRVAYTEVLADEQGATAAAFWRRAEAWFAARGVVVERVLTDNHFSYRGRLFNEALAEHRILHKYCRPYRPQTNGKVERFHRTLLEEWAYVRPYACEAARTRALARWLHRYNHHRVHTAIGGPPISRVTNVPREQLVERGGGSPAWRKFGRPTRLRAVDLAQFSAWRRSAVSSSVVMWLRYCVVDHP